MSESAHNASRPGPSSSALAVLVLTACGLLFLAQCYWHREFTVDDAYISYRYAHNLVEGHGLVFNEGERVEGYSNFLWVLLVAGAMKLGVASPEVATKVLGTLCGLLVVLLGPAAVARTTRLRGRACLLGALALAAWPPLAYWSISGLETSLFALLLTAGLLVWLSARGARSGVAAGGLMAVATLTRPEAPLFWLGSLVLRLVCEGRAAARASAAYALAYLVPLAPWLVWKIAYYGQVLPNTFYIKRRGGLWPPIRPGGVMYVEDFLSAHWGLIFWAALPLLVWPGLYLARRAWEFVAPLALYLVWVAKVGDWMPEYRFLVPVAALWAGASVGALGTLWQAAHAAPQAHQARRWARWAVAWLVFVALLHVGMFSHGGSPVDTARLAARYVGPGDLIAVHDAGLVPYLTRARTLDMIGLVSPEVLCHPVVSLPFDSTYQGKSDIPVRAGVVDMVLARRPALIETHIGGREGAFVADHPLDQLLLRRQDFRRGYVHLGQGLFLRRDLHDKQAPAPTPAPAPTRAGPD